MAKIVGEGKVTVPFDSFTETIIEGVAELLDFTLNGEDPGDPISLQACGSP